MSATRREAKRPRMFRSSEDGRRTKYTLTSVHASKSFEVMRDMWEKEEQCDLTLLVGGRSFRVHRVILSSCIPYVRAMLASGMRESRQDEIRLHAVDEDAMAAIIKYCYTGEIEVLPDFVMSLVAAANLLQMDELRDVCCTFMEEHLEPSNCLSTRCFAELHSFHKLVKAAETFACKHFEEVIHTDEFLAADETVVKRLLDSELVQVPSEEKIFFALRNWIAYDADERTAHALELLQCLRFSLLNHEFISSVIAADEFIQKSPECSAFFQGVLCAHTSLVKVRLPPKAVYVVGGRNSLRCLCSGEKYDPELMKWSAISEMRQVRTAVTLVQLQGYLYAIGGECEMASNQYGTMYLDTVERYSPKANCWEDIKSLQHARSFAASAVLDDHIYVVGGEDSSSSCLSSVEIFDPVSGEWTEGPDLNFNRSGAGCTVLDGYVYVVGGCNHDAYHNTVERYSPGDDGWSMFQNLQIARSGVAVCTFDDKIFVCGGRNRVQGTYYKTVECYDPALRRWRHVAGMKHKRAWAGCVVYERRIYLFGGYDGTERLDTVECYDPELDRWVMLDTHMGFQRAGCAATVV